MPSPGDEWMGWYSQTQGYRIYVINPDLQRITPVYDFYFKNPYTFYKEQASDYNINYMTSTRFDISEDYYSGEEWKGQKYTIDKLVDWCSVKDAEGNIVEKVATPPFPYKQWKPYAGQGAEFKDWFYAGMDTLGDTDTTSEVVEVVEVITPTTTGGAESTGTPNCTTCNDEGITTMPCPACKGSGSSVATAMFGLKCSKCAGDKVIPIKCHCQGYTCEVCKDTKLCMTCGGTKKTGLLGIACTACLATGICQSCKKNISQTLCGKCLGEGSVECPICKGTGSCGYRDCTICVGRGTIKCPSCSTKVTCTKCNKDVTSYGGVNCEALGGKVCVYCLYKFNNDGLCNKCSATMTEKDVDFIGRDSDIELEDMPNSAQYDYCNYPEICYNCSVETCTVCGAIYDADGYCTYCKCPLCNSQMTLKSEDNFYCSKCDRNVTYNQDVIKIEIPDSYWRQTTALTSSTKQEIEIGKKIINVAEQLPDKEKGQYWSNQPTYAKIESSAKSAIWLEFNSIFGTQTGADSTISPYDALLYATGIAGRDYKWDQSTVSGRLTAYAIYQAFLDIQDSQEYRDCYYSIQPLNTAEAITTNQPTLLTNLIPLSGTDSKEDKKVVPGKNLINSDYIEFPNGDYVKNEETKKSAMQLAMEDGCLIIVEPLCGFRMKCDVKNGEPQWGKYWAYGSFWNIAQHWYDNTANYYWNFLTNLTNNCLVTTKDVTTKAGYTIFAPENPDKDTPIQTSKTLMSSYSIMEHNGTDEGKAPAPTDYTNPMYGLSMHVYGYDVAKTITFDETLLNEDIADENDYLYLIGASPDHTDRVAEEKRSDPTKYANIVKFYETTDPVSGETTYKIFTREKIPELIEIVDEEHLTGYKLIEWFTSDKLCTNLEDPEITWEKLFNNDGFDRGKRGQLSIEYKNKYDRITTGLEPYTMNEKQRVNNSTDTVTKVEENTLYLLYRVGDATTSTYDEELGEEIGPSPDDTHKLIERTDVESFSTHEKYTTTPATIVKFYEELDSEGELISTEVFVRKEVPNTIEIEDESEFTGYQLQTWFTATQYRAVKEEQTYADFYDYYDSRFDVNSHIMFCNEASIVGLEPDTPEYTEAYSELYQTLSFVDEEGEETGEQVLYLHYTKSPSPSTLAVTSTYDEALGNILGPAPNNSSRLTDEQIEAGEYINIVKFYEDTDPSDPSTSYTKVFHRTQCPLIIAIQDESAPGQPGYKLVDWFTSDQYLPADILKDGDQYNELKSTIKVNNDGTYPENISFTDHVYLPDITLLGESDL